MKTKKFFHFSLFSVVDLAFPSLHRERFGSSVAAGARDPNRHMRLG